MKSLKSLVSYILLSGLAIFMIAPFVWMVLVSLQKPDSNIPTLEKIIPERFHWENYIHVLTLADIPIFRFFLNSVFVSAIVVVGQLFVSSIAAYAFARLDFRGKNFIFTLFLLSMMFAGPVTQIPVFLIVKNLGWLDTYAALIVPGLSSAFNIFLFRQFFVQIPKELDEAAKMDGAGEFLIYSRVVMPLSRSATATAGAFTFFAVWTDFFWPMLSTSSMELRTLEVGLSIFKNSYGQTNWPFQMTAAVIVMMPLLLVFLFTQKFFTKGVVMGGIK